MGTALIIVIGLIVLGLLVLALYNRMVARRNRVDNSWAQIDAALQRRHDLVPNLVEAVKGYAKHERETFERTTKARAGAEKAEGPPRQAAAESVLQAAIGRLLVIAEQYPELRASENFIKLQEQLTETENQIQITRRVYNDTVQTYNTLIQIFPPSLVARAFGFEPREFFDAPPEADAPPEVAFERGEGNPAAGKSAAAIERE